MHSVRFTAETSSGGVVERDFLVCEIPGALWAPASGADHAPIVLSGHNGGMHKKASGLLASALRAVTTWGFNVAAIDAPRHGDRPRTDFQERARTEIREAVVSGDTSRFAAASVRFTASLAEQSVSEWQATLDAEKTLHARPGDHHSARWVGVDDTFLSRHLGRA
ncbi:hypothetical protein [Micromonospora sp. NPDC047074]|uniref:hypothetical protein n=1 Tax=Micromonospora sp. NPDC047074 TaxID=3154339 RepID=UPI0033E7D3CB